MTADPRTLEERYSTAISTTHLEVDPGRCDADYLIAAGWLDDSLGASLLRLASEWDLASVEYRIALRHAREREAIANRLRAKLALGDASIARELADAEQAEKDAKAGAVTAKALALVHLKSLDGAKRDLTRFADVVATRTRYMAPSTVVADLAAQALRLFLDEMCQACGGRGFNGGYQSPRIRCTACVSGKVASRLKPYKPEDRFLADLLSRMDEKVANARRRMRQWLQQA